MMMKKQLLVVSLAGLLFGACSRQQASETKVRTVQTAKAEDGTLHLGTSFPGSVKASQEAHLSFRVAGAISQIYAEAGKPVRKGQVLATLDPSDYNAQLAATEAEYKSVKAQAERIIRLHEQGSVSTNDYDKAVGGLGQITQKLQAHRNAVSYTRILAPYDGYVQESSRKVGETVGAGMPVLSIYAKGAPEVEISISANDYLSRDRFKAFSCTNEAYPGVVFPLELISIDPISGLGQLHTVRLRFADKTSQSLPSVGMSVNVHIDINKGQDSGVRIPMQAIWERNGKSYVWVLTSQEQGDPTVQAREVKLLQILQNGLAECQGIDAGTEVVSAGVTTLSDGEAVRPLAPTSNTNVGGLL